MPHFNIADLALALIWLYCSFRGYLRGLVTEIGSLAAIATGFYCAGTYHKALAPHLTPYISGNYAGTAAYLIIFAGALFGVWFLTLAVSGIVKITMTQWADRFFGGAFGLAKGFLITAAVLFLIQLAMPHPEFLKGSRLVPVLEQVTSHFVRYIPPSINTKLRSWAKTLPTTSDSPAEPAKTAQPAQPESGNTTEHPSKVETTAPAKTATAKTTTEKPVATKKTSAATPASEKHND